MHLPQHEKLKNGLALLKADFSGCTSDTLATNIRLNNYHGIMSTLAQNLVGPFIGIFAVRLGASNYQIGLLSSAPALMALLAMIPGAKYVDSRSNKKRVTAAFMWAHRLFFFLLALIPLFAEDSRATILVILIAAMNFPGAISNVGWQGFIANVVPSERRAAAFADRNRLMNIVGTLAVLGAGRMLDIMPFPLGYRIMFTLAFVLAIGEIWVFSRLKELSPSGTPAHGQDVPWPRFLLELPRSIAADIKGMAHQKRFLRFTATSLFFHFAWQVAWPLFTLYQTRELGANNLWISMLTLSNTGGTLLGYGFWVRYTQKYGSLKTLFISSLGMFMVPLVHAYSRSLTTIALFNIITGVIFSGVMLSLFNALLDMTPEDRRTTSIGYYNTAISLGAIAAPLAGVAMLNLFGYKVAFLVAAALRILGGLAFGAVYWLETAEQKKSAANP
ncbi:MAG: MFS transporter [Selenomonadales bacterium]|nr:MFS transporter [Selenomonadales bacterium]